MAQFILECRVSRRQDSWRSVVSLGCDGPALHSFSSRNPHSQRISMLVRRSAVGPRQSRSAATHPIPPRNTQNTRKEQKPRGHWCLSVLVVTTLCDLFSPRLRVSAVSLLSPARLHSPQSRGVAEPHQGIAYFLPDAGPMLCRRTSTVALRRDTSDPTTKHGEDAKRGITTRKPGAARHVIVSR